MDYYTIHDVDQNRMGFVPNNQSQLQKVFSTGYPTEMIKPHSVQALFISIIAYLLAALFFYIFYVYSYPDIKEDVNTGSKFND